MYVCLSDIKKVCAMPGDSGTYQAKEKMVWRKWKSLIGTKLFSLTGTPIPK